MKTYNSPITALRYAAAFIALILPLRGVSSMPIQQSSQEKLHVRDSRDEVPIDSAKYYEPSLRLTADSEIHSFTAVLGKNGHWQAHNPGQQWTMEFDGNGFVVQPSSAGWQWGLDLESYGFGNSLTSIRGKAAARAEGHRFSYQWDSILQEWYVNDQRGLEHGFTLSQRPEGTAGTPLTFTMITRGGLIPQVMSSSVQFKDSQGNTMIHYSGLKVWDADGVSLPSRFEPAGSTSFRLLVDESAARYPIYIDPIAQQTPVSWFKAEGNTLDETASNNGTAQVGVTYSQGRVGQSFNFSGGSVSAITCGNNASLQLSSGTLAAWIKTADAGSSYRGIVVKQFAYGLFLNNNNLVLFDWHGGVEQSTGITLNDNQWHHVALTFQSGVLNGSKIFIDGELRKTFTWNVSNQSQGLSIGSGFSSGMGQNFAGMIDEVRIYSTAFSEIDMQEFKVPTVSSIFPDKGSSAGGSAVTITGTNFTGAAGVTIGGVAATNFSVVNHSTISCNTPAGSAGSVSVLVNKIDSTNSANTLYTYVAPPTVTSILPNMGQAAGGTMVTITGTHFSTALGVSFGGIAAGNINVLNDTTITCTTPSGSVGAASVLVTTAGGTNVANTLYTYVAPPTLTSISRQTGSSAGGTSVTINGTHFSTAVGVSFGGIAASNVNVLNATAITCTTPAGSVGSVSVLVTTAGGTNATNTLYTYVAPPIVTAVSPNKGSVAGGNSLHITGTNFTGTTSVSIGGAAATNITVYNDRTITCISPPGTFGSASILVTTPGETNAANALYTYVAPPTVDASLPAFGSTAGGTTVQIVGAGFTGASGVQIGGEFATGLSVLNDNTLTCITPAGLAGATSVIVFAIGGNNQTNVVYTYLAPPTVTAISPNKGNNAGGTNVTITGESFIGTTTVTIGGAPATNLNVEGDTLITCTTPAGLNGSASVNVTNEVGTNLANALYTYVVPPTVTAISPVSGGTPGGTAVTITGSGFTSGSSVKIGGIPATNLIVVNSTTITCITPAGTAGNASVLVTSDDFTNTANALYTYVPGAPRVTAIAPNIGSNNGGTTITLTGTDFTNATGVSIGGVAVTNLNVVNATTITCTTPAGTVGSTSVNVTTPLGTNSANSLYTYVAVPAPLSWYRAEANANDDTGAHNGTVQGGVSYATGRVGQGFNFDGINTTTIMCGNNTNQQLSNGTIAAWIKTPNAGSGYRAILVKQFAYGLFLNDNSLIVYDWATSTEHSTNIPLNDNTWHHVALTFQSGIADGTKIYIDGTLQKTFTWSASAQTEGLSIGAGDANGTTQNFVGMIDEALVYSSALTDLQIKAVFHSGGALVFPIVAALSPSTGSTDGGTLMTINGTGFTGATSVMVGGNIATSVNLVNANTITCTTPAGTAGIVEVLVTTPGGTNIQNHASFTYVEPPRVTSILPNEGSSAGGTAVTISGSGFWGASGVTIGGAEATNVTVVSDATITCETPVGDAGLANVQVTYNGVSNAPATIFTYLAEAPTISEITPNRGKISGGNVITLRGRDFSNATAVTIGGQAVANFNVVNARTITCTTPAGVAGSASVLVTTPLGTNTTNTLYTYVLAPAITTIYPEAGSTQGGFPMQISGTDLTGTTRVTIRGVEATDINVLNDGFLTCVTPPGTAGTAEVQLTAPGGTILGNMLYRYVEPPTAATITPNSGSTAGGTYVTITGTGFTGATSVVFGGIHSHDIIVLNDSTITCITPPLSGSESTVSVGVNTPGGESTRASELHFTYVAPQAILALEAIIKAPNSRGGHQFGSAVAVDGNTAVIGASYEDNNSNVLNSTPSVGLSGIGAAYVFIRNGTAWDLQAYLKASNMGENDRFGSSVSISEDTIVIGAFGESSNATSVNGNQTNDIAPYSGAAYVFTRSGNTWTQEAYLKASNAEAEDFFGGSVGVSGNTIVVGAGGEDSSATGVNGNQADNSSSDSGAAYIFTRNGTTWTQQAYLKSSQTQFEELFGSVSISGDTVVIGASGHDSYEFVDSGAAYVFIRSAEMWSQQAVLYANNNGDNFFFGGSVAVSGDTLVIGANGESSNATGLNGDGSNRDAPESGAAYIFTRLNNTWSQQAYLKPRAVQFDSTFRFGSSVAISGDTVVVGSPYQLTTTPQGIGSVGAAYVFSRSGSTWSDKNVITGQKLQGLNSRFYLAVAVSGDIALIGNPYESREATGANGDPNSNQLFTGAAYTYSGILGHSGATSIGVSGSGVNISNGDHTPATVDSTDFGTTAAGGGGIVREFTITNTGATDLVLTPETPNLVTLYGVDSANFRVSTQPTNRTIPRSGSQNFSITYDPIHAGTHTIRVVITSNDAINNPYTFTLTGTAIVPEQAFNGALASAGLVGPNAAPTATPFNDGVPNLLKYAFNMNLAGPDSATMSPAGNSGLPSISTAGTGDEAVLSVAFVRRVGSGLVYTPKKSSTLGSGSFVPLSASPTVTPIGNDGLWERVTYAEPVSLSTTPACFSVVEVVIP